MIEADLHRDLRKLSTADEFGDPPLQKKISAFEHRNDILEKHQVQLSHGV